MGASQAKVALAESIATLKTEPKSSTDPFWDTLLSAEFTERDLFSVLAPDTVRELVASNAANLRILLNMTTGHCHNYIISTEPPTPLELRVVTNSTTVLSRLLPFILESKAPLVEDLLWKTSSAGDEVSVPSYDELCLAHKILRTLTEILFRPDFSLGPRTEVDVSRIIWIEGLVEVGADSACKTPPGGPMQTRPLMDERCVCVLRAMLGCFSEALYAPQAEVNSTANRWLAWATSPSNALAPALFSALINLALNYDPVGWGLPYNYLVQPDESHERLVSTAMHVLILLLDYSEPAGAAGGAAVAPNAVRDSLAAMKKKSDLAKVYNGFGRLLSNPHQVTGTYLPNSMKEIDCQDELLVLLWKFLLHNPDFLAFAKMNRPAGLNILLEAVCFFICANMADPAKASLVHICIFTLLLFSGEREFSVALNDPLTNVIPASIASGGAICTTYADLLVLTVHKLMVDGGEGFASIGTCCITIIANVSPYTKAFSSTATSKLLDLLETLMTPLVVSIKKLSAAEVGSDAHAAIIAATANLYRSQTPLLLLLLEMVNNVLQYQSEGNARLTYALVHQAERIQLLTSPPPRPPDVGGQESVSRNSAAVADCAQQLEAKAALVLRLSADLLPTILQFCSESAAAEDAVYEDEVVAFLERHTLVGLLPVPHPILIRKYQETAYTGVWVTTYIWSVVYLRQHEPPLFDSKTIKLFTVQFGDEGRSAAGGDSD